MANQEATQVMSLPLPPTQYINLYTDDNVRKNRIPRPPHPNHDAYSMFGTYNNDAEMIRPLESQGIRRLIPMHYDRRKELKKLNHSLFANFLELIDLLVHQPDSQKRVEKIEDLSLIFVHIHHLLNEFRPHQARESLRVLMEMQKRQRIETTVRFQKHLEKCWEVVKRAFNSLPDTSVLDSKLVIPMDITIENKNSYGTDGDACDPSDRLMCDIIDKMPMEHLRN